MNRFSFQQFAIIQADSAQQLTNKLNRKLYELKDKDPNVTFDGLTARISYYIEEPVTDSINTGFDNVGISFKCRDCPYFEPLKKRDGTPDRRTTFGLCSFAVDGQTISSAKACKKLFEMIKEKEVVLCLAKD